MLISIIIFKKAIEDDQVHDLYCHFAHRSKSKYLKPHRECQSYCPSASATQSMDTISIIGWMGLPFDLLTSRMWFFIKPSWMQGRLPWLDLYLSHWNDHSNNRTLWKYLPYRDTILVYFNQDLIASLPTTVAYTNYLDVQKININVKSLLGKNNISVTMYCPPPIRY